MGKTLYLIRHAKSSWDNANLDDFDRPLNKRGKRDAPFMGELLKKSKVNPQLIITSPANRAISTAYIFCEKIGYPVEKIEEDQNIYLADAESLLYKVNTLPDKFTTVMMFGHNPGFTTLTNYLSDKRIDNMPTCSIAGIHFNIENWKEVKTDSGKLIYWEYPKKHRR